MAQNNFEKIYDLALKLSVEDRSKLAADLIASLGPESLEKDQGYDEAWTEETERRMEYFERFNGICDETKNIAQ